MKQFFLPEMTSTLARRHVLRSILIAWILLGAACPRRGPEIQRLPGVTAEALLQSLVHQAALRRSAVGLLRIDYVGQDGLFKGKADIAIQRATKLRIELRSFFGQPAATLANDGQNFVFLDSQAMQARCGDVDDPMLQTLLPGGLSAQDTVAALLGTVALPQLESDAPVAVAYIKPEPGETFALRWMSRQQEYILGLDASGSRLLRLRQRDRQSPVYWEVMFSDFRQGPLGDLAQQGEIAWSDRVGRLRWRWQEQSLNMGERRAEFWRPPVPPGFSSSTCGKSLNDDG